MRTALALSLLFGLACGPARFGCHALFPSPPEWQPGETVELPGLGAEVQVTRRDSGIWRVAARSEDDGVRALGYLQARDRMFQLDLLRHLARGELAGWIGERPLGGRTTLETDLLNRFLGFRARAESILAATSEAERATLDAFSEGVDAWIAAGVLSPEHHLLGVEAIEPWTPLDSLTLYAFLMHGLSGNADREVRRLVLACEAGLGAAERIWPTALEFPVHALPDEALPAHDAPPLPGVAPELAAELPARCAEGRADAFAPFASRPPSPALSWAGAGPFFDALMQGRSASNNWAVHGGATASGGALLATDPHLPHANPPLLWGFELETPELRVAGFTLPGLHRVVFGHNGHVAFGATTNHVDRQDLRVARLAGEGYAWDGGEEAFEVRTERFAVRGAEPVTASARFTRHGPVLNDIDVQVRGRIPITSLQVASAPAPRDLDGSRALQRARTLRAATQALAQLDLGCSSWLVAGPDGIAFRSPCRVPIRTRVIGTFPAPGWDPAFSWQGYHAKEDLPASTNPARGWLATANSRIVPARRFPGAYNNDPSAPNRFLRISGAIGEQIEAGRVTAATSAALQRDVGIATWDAWRALLEAPICADPPGAGSVANAASLLCGWDGGMRADSASPTLWVLLTHALLDASVLDELPGESGRDAFDYVQGLFQFEAAVQWLWWRADDDPLFDDVRTPERETRAALLAGAFEAAVAEGARRWQGEPDSWTWGRVRPFRLRHLFSSGEGPLSVVLDSDAIEVSGGTETPWKQQFPRSDRDAWHPSMGPPARLVVDLADPWAAEFTMAGGASGWPGSRFYGNLLEEWASGIGRPLTPGDDPGDVAGRLVPVASAH